MRHELTNVVSARRPAAGVIPSPDGRLGGTAPLRSRLGLCARCGSRRRGGFTLMELMVAIGILVIIILAVGVTFSSASKSVGVSEATMDLLANVRATQELLARDLSGLDKSGYLVIRCRALDTTSNERVEDGLRFDQIGFMAHGSFPDRTGTVDPASTFTNAANSNTGLVWWGHLVMEKQGGSKTLAGLSNAGPAQSYLAPNQSLLSDGTFLSSWPGILPTGAYVSNSSPYGSEIDVTKNSDGTLNDNNFYLGRHVFLLMPPAGYAGGQLPVLNGKPVNAFPNPSLSAALLAGFDGSADIASSRYDVVAMSPSQVMGELLQMNTNATLDNWAEALYMTYRFRALASVYDTELQSFTNGYFRSTPIVMQGVSSFKVEWTDGYSWTKQDVDNGKVAAGLLDSVRWFGPTNAANIASVERNFSTKTNPNGSGDNYLAIFNQSNRPFWPKALRITMHVGSSRLQGGRDFVQIVNLPQ